MRKAPITIVTTLAIVLAACSGGSDDATDTAAITATEATPEAIATDPTAGAAQTDATTAAATDATVDAEASAEPTPTPEPRKDVAKTAEVKADPTPAKIEVAAAEPPATYVRCVMCHTADKGGANRLGPNLYGTYGKKAGVHSGFSYSSALKDSGVTWTDANLHAWLENPRTFIPGNRMSFAGVKDAATRQEIIDYLKKQR